MSLENLLKTRQLERHETDATQVGRLLNSSGRCLNDARQDSITAETRLEAGYRAIMQLRLIDNIQAAVNQGLVLGTDRFRAEVEQLTGQPQQPLRRDPKPRPQFLL